MFTIGRHCEQCKKFSEIELKDVSLLSCPHCSVHWGEVKTINEILQNCPVCGCRQFYQQKDFNQGVGCLIMLVGIGLVSWTYGLSLPVFSLIDWLIYRKIPSMAVCYRCGAEFKGFDPSSLKSFKHHIGLKYDKFRT